MTNQGLVLDKVVLLGRTLEEYARYFGLRPESLRGRKVLDVASGVSSFCAEANASGIDTIAFDPIYALPPAEIQARCEPDLDTITRDIALAKTYRWEFYKSPLEMRNYRERAYRSFLADYPARRGTRYVAGSLPRIPFADRQFDMTLMSYLLFVYERQFDYEFHKQSILEIMRVTRDEARFYPLVTFEAQPSRHLDALMNDPELEELKLEVVGTDFEFLIGSNRYLSIRHR